MPDGPIPMIPPQPVPTVWAFDTTDEGSHVVQIAQTPLGTFVFFIEPDSVDKHVAALQGEQAKALAKRKKAHEDIVVPGQVLLGPDGNPLANIQPSAAVQEHLHRMKAKGTEAQIIDAEVIEDDGETGDSNG